MSNEEIFNSNLIWLRTHDINGYNFITALMEDVVNNKGENIKTYLNISKLETRTKIGKVVYNKAFENIANMKVFIDMIITLKRVF